MKRWLALLGFGLAACNYDVGECYLRNEGGEGGGGIVLPTGVGGFGDVPREPQNSGDSWDADPCSSLAECTVTWRAGSSVCNMHGESGKCTTLHQGEHTSLTEAQEWCEKAYGVGGESGAESCSECKWVTGSSDDPIERCKKNCDKINLKCIARCPKNDKSCMNKCNQEYSKCLKDCG